MNHTKCKFLNELADKLSRHPEKRAILQEYEQHIHELVQEGVILDKDDYAAIETTMGTTDTLAGMWQQELRITPRKTQGLFIFCNLLFFCCGALLTIGIHTYEWHWLTGLWERLIAAPHMVIIAYACYWALLGFEMGKEFGHSGKSLLRRTFTLSVVPNVVLMVLVVLNIIPFAWFGTLLTLPFIILCVVFTTCIYPICLAGYYWGKRLSI